MRSSDEERSGRVQVGTIVALLANLIVVVQFVGEHLAMAVLGVLAAWGVGLAYGRRILDWLVRHRRDLLFLLLGAAVASIGITGVLHSRSEPAPPAPTPCPDMSTPAPEPSATPDETASPSEIVYRTPSGERYHRATCSHVKGKAIPLTLKEAKEKGLTPCKACHPPPLP